MPSHPQTVRTLRTRLLRTLVAAALSGGLLLLAACGGDDSSTASPSGTAAPSTSASSTPSPSAAASVKASTDLSALTATGAYGKAPKVKIAKTPWAIDKTRTKVLSKGTGPVTKATDSVLVNYYGVDGRTGKVFDQSFDKGQPVEFPLSGVIAGFKKGLTGQQQGSRVLVAMPGPDGYDASGGNAQAGINVGDTLVFVVDIVSIPKAYTKALSQPTGTTVKPKAGLPTVSGSLTDPTITPAKGKAPTAVVVQPLIKGDGVQVTQADTITFHYSWQTWTGKKVEDDYGKAASQASVAGLVGGLNTALVGQPIGSRVLVVVPYKTAYPDTAPDAKTGIKTTDTLVFVVDILFAKSS